MFPGGGGQRGEWFTGIGYLISEAISNQKTKIIMAFIEGTSTWDYLKLIPGAGIFMPKPKVTFSNEESIAIYNNMEPKAIAMNLKNKYDLWVEDLPKQDKWWERVINKIPSIPENAYYLTRCLVLWVMTRPGEPFPFDRSLSGQEEDEEEDEMAEEYAQGVEIARAYAARRGLAFDALPRRK